MPAQWATIRVTVPRSLSIFGKALIFCTIFSWLERMNPAQVHVSTGIRIALHHREIEVRKHEVVAIDRPLGTGTERQVRRTRGTLARAVDTVIANLPEPEAVQADVEVRQNL